MRKIMGTARAIILIGAIWFSMLASFGEEEGEPAKLKVTGYGLFGNRELKAMVAVLQKTEERPEFLDANYIEDAILILFSRLQRDGYLVPTIRAEVEYWHGGKQVFTWTEALGEPLPRPMEAKRVVFEIDPGVLFHFEEIQFSGVDDLMPLRNAAR